MVEHDNPRTLTPHGEKIFRDLKATCEHVLEPEPNKSLPEDIFVNYFLPKFLREEKHPGNKWISYWINTCNGIGRELDITSVETGQILYTVPPIVGVKSLTPFDDTKGGLGINAIVNTYHAKLSGLPNPAHNFYNREMKDKYKYLVENLDIREDVKRWMLIVLRYRAMKFTEDGKIEYVPLEATHEKLGDETEYKMEGETPSTESPQEDLNDLFDF